MLETSIRTLASLLFAVVVCASFLSYLTVSKLKNTVLEPSFYTTVLEENDSYETIHSGLLTELEAWEELGQLQDDLGVDSDEFTELANEVAPVSYVKAQIDGIITGVLNYLRSEAEDPQVFIDFAGPLQRIKPATLNFVDRRVESGEQTHPTTAEEYAAEAQNLIQYLERGEIPPRVPSLDSIPESEIESAFDQVLPVLSYLEPNIAENLEAQWPAIKATALGQPDGPEAMKQAARAVVAPYIDEAIAEVRVHLDQQDRFDLVEAAAEASDMPRDQFLEDVDEIRDPINTLHGAGSTVALLVMAFATLGMALVNLPHRVSMLMWPGIVLILTGIVAIAVSVLLSSLVANATYDICGDAAEFACQPAVDILRELTRSLADFPMLPSVLVILIGGIGVTLASVVVAKRASGTGGPRSRRTTNAKEGW